MPSANRAEGVGVIIPPPEVRELLEKTAGFIAKKASMEARIAERHRDDPRFTFLHSSDPYHAYYRQRVTELRGDIDRDKPDEAGLKPTQNGIREQENDEGDRKNNHSINDTGLHLSAQLVAEAKELPLKESSHNIAPTTGSDLTGNTTIKAAEISLLKTARAKAEARRPEPREPPPEDIFSLPEMSPLPTALGLDVMKLTAQFAAQHGPEFVTRLAQREERNVLFDFLKPMHPHFVAYHKLVEAYTIILDTGAAKARLVERMKTLTLSPDAMLNEVWYLHDWDCQKAEREHEAALDEREKIRRAQIDWHDFVVLATVDFDGDIEDNQRTEVLPAPIADVRQLPRMLAAARRAQVEREKNRGDVDMDVDTRDTSTALAKTVTRDVESAQPKDARVELGNIDSDIPADRIRPAAPTVSSGSFPTTIGAAASTPHGSLAEATVVLPSGQRVPLSKVQQSVKAELLNPSYKAERERAAEKNRLHNLAGGDEVARNLARWEQAHVDGGVYNRGDLQEALSGRRKVPDVDPANKVRSAPQSGPALPPSQPEALISDSTQGRPPKRARVDKASDTLSKAKSKDEENGVGANGSNGALDADTDKTEEKISGLVSAEEWLQKQGNKAKIRVLVTTHNNKDWKLQGQEINMSAPLKSTVAKLKSVMAQYTKLPANKQKLQMDKVGFLKDKMTLAAYNIGDGAIITLEVKERGGRKKH